jgi:hypothetical protein
MRRWGGAEVLREVLIVKVLTGLFIAYQIISNKSLELGNFRQNFNVLFIGENMGPQLVELAFRGAAGATIIHLVMYIILPQPPVLWLIEFAGINIAISEMQALFLSYYWNPGIQIGDILFINCVVWGFACLVMLLTRIAHHLLLTETEQVAHSRKATSRDVYTNK